MIYIYIYIHIYIYSSPGRPDICVVVSMKTELTHKVIFPLGFTWFPSTIVAKKEAVMLVNQGLLLGAICVVLGFFGMAWQQSTFVDIWPACNGEGSAAWASCLAPS